MASLRPGRAVLLGFPQDEGVRRNGGRPGAAAAPERIRHWLYRLTPWDATSGIDLADHSPLDLGDVRVNDNLEDTQDALGSVIAAILQAGAVPLVLGGGHETAYGHYLGYVKAGKPVAIVNLDAHLDVRPCTGGVGHSGTPFRQAMEHPTCPLPGAHYLCLGAQPHSVSHEHFRYIQERGGQVRWRPTVTADQTHDLARTCESHFSDQVSIYLTVDADVVQMADVPGVSAPNPSGIPGILVADWLQQAGGHARITSVDLVEICPAHDRDDHSSRWAALALWRFLIGLAARSHL